MAYDYSKLSGKIIEIFGTRSNFANAMEMSERTLSLKLNNLTSWKQPEITKACRLLGISEFEIKDYFFTLTVQEPWTNKNFKRFNANQ